MSEFLTVEDFLQEVEKNGLSRTQGRYFRYNEDNTKITSACAVGMGAYNLNLPPEDIDFSGKYELTKVNDSMFKGDFKAVTDSFREIFPSFLDQKIYYHGKPILKDRAQEIDSN